MIQDRTILKSYFQAGDRPTQQQFIDLIDTLVAKGEDTASGKIVGTLDAISDLQNLTPLISGIGIQLLGYNTALDGGGGPIVWDPNEDKQNHDGGFIISPTWNNGTFGDASVMVWGQPDPSDTGTGAWIRPESIHVPLKWFGAAADGITNDKWPIQNAIRFCEGGKTLIIPKGEYLTGTVNIGNSDIDIIGENGATLIRTGFRLMTISNLVENVKIEKIIFDSNAANEDSDDKTCLRIHNVQNVTVKDCRFVNGLDTSITDKNQDGIYIISQDAANTINDITIENCKFNEFSRNGISVTDGVNGLEILNSEFKNCTHSGIDLESNDDTIVQVYDALIDNCRFIDNGNEGSAGFGLAGHIFSHGGDASSYHSRGLRINNCYFKTITATNATAGGITPLLIQRAKDFKITNCVFEEPDNTEVHEITIDSSGNGSDDGLIEGCTFNDIPIESFTCERIKWKNNTFTGNNFQLNLQGGTDFDVSGNTFNNCGNSALTYVVRFRLFDSTFDNNKVRDDRSFANQPTKFFREMSQNWSGIITISNCNIDGISIFIDADTNNWDNLTIEDCKFRDVGVPIRIDGPSSVNLVENIALINNDIIGADDRAIDCFRVDGLRILDNDVQNTGSGDTNTSHGTRVRDCNRYLVASNVYQDTRIGTFRADRGFSFSDANSGSKEGRSVVHGNLAINTQNGIFVPVSEGADLDNTYYSS